jgi:photosystem II stability/assembly factor-like uncharacterized protein
MRKILIIVFCTLLSGGLFAQWTNLNINQNVISTFKSENVVLAGTENGIYFNLEGETTWNQSTGIKTEAFCFSKYNNIIYVSSHDSIFKSNDNGISWVSLPKRFYTDVNHISVWGSNIIAGTNSSGIKYSNDYGITWDLAGTSWQSHYTSVIKKGNAFFATTEFSGYLQYSTDTTGQNWRTPKGNGIKIGTGTTFQDIQSLTTINDSILIAATNYSSTDTTYDGVYFSYDNGDNFTKRINGITKRSINSVANIGNVVFAATDGGGVFYSTDEGLNWHSLNDGLSNLTITNLFVHQSSLFACTSTGLFEMDVCSLLQNTSEILPKEDTTASETIELKANLSGINYNWYKNNVIISDANAFNYLATETGTYKVGIEYSASCNNFSNEVNVTIQMLGNDNALTSKNNMFFYPNPITDFLNIENLSKDTRLIRVSDINGKTLYSKETNSEKIKLEFLNYPKGIYLIELIGDSKEVIKVFKE